MARTKRFIGAILMGLLLCFSLVFAGCQAKIEGTYKFSSMSYSEGGVQIEINAGEQFMGMMTLNEDYMTITLNEDGTVSMSTSALEDVETQTGTWTKTEDGKVEITIDDEPQVCECDGKTLTIEQDGAKIVLKK